MTDAAAGKARRRGLRLGFATPGSTLWLLGCEMRLAWRGGIARRAGSGLKWVLVLAMLALLVVGVPLGLFLRDQSIPDDPVLFVAADGVAAVIFTLMLSQTLATAIEALYTRDDFDLLLSSPIAPRKILFVRFAALAANAFASFAAFIAPILLPVALIGHPAWLGVLVVLAALALTASACGLWLAMLLFRLIGPRRTRGVAQVLAALIGAAFFLIGQSANLAGRRSGGVWMALIRFAREQGQTLPPEVAWVLHAMVGRPAPLAAVALGGMGFFGVTAWSLGNRFVADAAAASGAAVPMRKPKGRAKAFASGAFAATYAKETRLLWRDIAMLAQVLLRVLYLLPLAFVMVRNAGEMSTSLLPFGVLTLCVAAGQVASSLVWITVAAEELPALLASAPAPMAVIRRAKLAAAMTPLAVLLAAPLIALTVFAPASGIAAIAGCAATAWTTGLIAAWRQKPGKRSDFRARRRSGGSLVAGLGTFFVSLLIGAAAAMASVLWIWALIPAALAAVLVLALRRSDAQMAQALQAAT